MLKVPYYNPKKTYDENYEHGPFGAFADGKIFEQKGIPTYKYFGQKVFLPFGIPAGPIINSSFAKGAFEKGFDVVVYKTVRTRLFPCHPFPNILSIDTHGDLTIDKLKNKLIAQKEFTEPLSITNSFGVPSKKAEDWQEDVKKALSFQRKGQTLVLSFMGTVVEGQSQDEFINDYVLAAKLAMETGVKILETNLSCPNIGNEGLVCYNLKVTQKICDSIKNTIGNLPLIIKVGYYEEDEILEELCEIANKYVAGISCINTLQAEIIDSKGNQALPGKNRIKSGVCGSSIKWAGIDMVKRLNKIRSKKGYNFAIEGVGGVMKKDDYFDYKKAGADSVMSATGSMWNPNLAQEIKRSI